MQRSTPTLGRQVWIPSTTLSDRTLERGQRCRDHRLKNYVLPCFAVGEYDVLDGTLDAEEVGYGLKMSQFVAVVREQLEDSRIRLAVRS